MARGKSRLNLEMPERVRQAMEELKTRTDAGSLADVVKRALTVYDFVLSEQERGATIVVRQPDGTEKEVLLL